MHSEAFLSLWKIVEITREFQLKCLGNDFYILQLPVAGKAIFFSTGAKTIKCILTGMKVGANQKA